MSHFTSVQNDTCDTMDFLGCANNDQEYRQMKLQYSKRTYAFRSPGLFAFLGILKDAYPGWVDLAGIEARLPHIHPRQLARFVDLLEAAGLQLVRYETKTRGRFQLAVKPESIVFTGDQPPPSKTAHATQVPCASIAIGALSIYQNSAWVAWVIALMESSLAMHDGNPSGMDSALEYLNAAKAASASLPLWTTSVVHVRRASLLAKGSRYREATFWLRRVDTAVRDGLAHPAVKTKAQLVRAKMRYDQARYAEAEQLLGAFPSIGMFNYPSWLNMKALVSGRKFLAAKEADAPDFLLQTLSALAEALGYVFLSHGDSNLLDGLCYNFANNLQRGIKRGVIPEDCADTVMQWLAANLLVCRKLGIGEDSIFASLLLVDVALDQRHSIKQWPHLLSCEISVSGDIKGVLAKALTQARQMGNKIEIAQCLRREIQMVKSPDAARAAYLEAVESFDNQGKPELVRELAKEWFDKFGRAPPALRKTGRLQQ